MDRYFLDNVGSQANRELCARTAASNMTSTRITSTRRQPICNIERYVDSPLSSSQKWHWQAGLGMLPLPPLLYANVASIIEWL